MDGRTKLKRLIKTAGMLQRPNLPSGGKLCSQNLTHTHKTKTKKKQHTALMLIASMRSLARAPAQWILIHAATEKRASLISETGALGLETATDCGFPTKRMMPFWLSSIVLQTRWRSADCWRNQCWEMLQVMAISHWRASHQVCSNKKRKCLRIVGLHTDVFASFL